MQVYLRDGFCSCCHIETEVVVQMFCLTQPQYTDTGPTSPNVDPTIPGVRQGTNWRTTNPRGSVIEPRSEALEVDAFATRPTRRLIMGHEAKGSSLGPTLLELNALPSRPQRRKSRSKYRSFTILSIDTLTVGMCVSL